MNGPRHRNPYVILGIPYGADASEARRGFAAKSRLVKRNENTLYGIDDLTWALHQIEQERSDPSVDIDVYRIPADPEALETDDIGLFNPPPEPYPLNSELSFVDAAEAVEVAFVLHSCIEELATRTAHLPDPLLESEQP